MGFLLSILGFWKGLPAPVKKIAEYAALIALVLWGFKVFWLNPDDNKVAAEERMKVTEDMRKAAEAKYQQQIKLLEGDKKNIEDKAAALQATNDTLVKSRESIVSSLNKSLVNIKLIGATAHGQDIAVPDYMLDATLRAVSNALECSRPGNNAKAGCAGAADSPGKATTP